MDRSVCIVGGGIAGAGAALSLPEHTEITVLESRRIGGRLAARRQKDCIYDHGTPHMLLPEECDRERLLEAAGDTLVEIEDAVKQFDASGTISAHPNEYVRYSGRGGIDTVVRALFEDSGASIEEGTMATELARHEGEWIVTASGDRRRFDGLILAVPAAGAAVLLQTAEWDDPVRDQLSRVADRIPHRTIDVVALHYPFELDVSYYGLVSVERASDVVWLGREACKPEHVPPGESVVTLQLGTQWSAANADATPQETAIESAHYAASLIGDDRLREPDWWDHHRWGQAVPESEFEGASIDRTLEADLALAGDWVAGLGQAHAAFDSGVEAGRRLSERLGLDPAT